MFSSAIIKDREPFGARPYVSLRLEVSRGIDHLARRGARHLSMATVTTPTPDPVLDTQMFWMRNKVAIMATVAGLLVLFAAYSGYRYYTTQQNRAAALLLSQAKTGAEYQKVIEQYPRSNAASSAYLMLAAAQRKEQKFAEANASLKTFLEKYPKHEFVTTAMMAMAGNLDGLGKGDEAIEQYRRVAAEHPRSFNAPLALMAEVPLLKAKGDFEGARRVCETVLTQYRDSVAAPDATRQLRLMKSAQPAAVPAPGGQGSAEQSAPPVIISPAASAAATP